MSEENPQSPTPSDNASDQDGPASPPPDDEVERSPQPEEDDDEQEARGSFDAVDDDSDEEIAELQAKARRHEEDLYDMPTQRFEGNHNDIQSSENEGNIYDQPTQRIEMDDSVQDTPASPTQQEDDEDGDGDLKTKIFGDSDDEDISSSPHKKRKLIVDDDDDDDDIGTKRAYIEDDDDPIIDESEVQEGASTSQQREDSSSEDEGIDRGNSHKELVWDFDVMMARKKEDNYRRKKKRNIDIINDSDDAIADMIRNMKQAAENDFEYNKIQKPATSKLLLLNQIEGTLKKIDLREALLDSGILSVITDWLTPLPDRSLPNIKVRETLLKLLLDFNITDTDRLKASGIGKAIMYLFKHPKETGPNKSFAKKLITNWSRPIFNNETDFSSISREERELRDQEMMARRKRKTTENEQPVPPPATAKVSKPGDKEWVPRARVPQPSTKDYVIRPKSNLDIEVSGGRSSKKALSRFESMQRSFNEKKKAGKVQRAVKISIEGRQM